MSHLDFFQSLLITNIQISVAFLLNHPWRFGDSNHLSNIITAVALGFFKDFSRKAKKMVENNDTCITRVLFCGHQFPGSQNYTREYLRNYPCIQVNDVPLDDVPDVIADYHVCVLNLGRLDSEVISCATQMKLIMQFGVGLEGVDVDAATRWGIKVGRIPGNISGNSASCAEMAIYLMLGLLRKQKKMDIAVRQRRSGEPTGETLFGKTVYIMGLGNIGTDLAKRLRPFGVKILATKRCWSSGFEDSRQPNGIDTNLGSSIGIESPSLSIGSNGFDDLVDKKGGPEDLFNFAREADIIVTCLALNNETAGIVSNKFLSSMKKGGLLVNIARGGLLDYEAVTNHLESGHLGGLGIDVAWNEPFNPDDPILKFENVIFTPHVAGVTEYSYRSMAKIFGETVLQLHAGTPFTGHGVEFVN